MTYALIDVILLACASLAAVLLSVLGRDAHGSGAGGRDARRRARSWVPALAAGVALIALTAVFDNAMIAAGLFGYAPEALLGPAVGLAPVEDFAYPLAAAVLLPVLWRRLAGGERARRSVSGSGNSRDALTAGEQR